MAKLNNKQQRFVHEYIEDLNATQAAIRAGYSAKTAKAQGARLLTHVDITAAIQEAKDDRAKRTGITVDRVLKELALLAFSDIRHFEVDDAGRLVVVEGAPSDDVGRSVASVKQKVLRVDTDKETGATETILQTELKLWDKNSAIDKLCKHLGMFIERREITGKDGAPLQVIAIGGKEIEF